MAEIIETPPTEIPDSPAMPAALAALDKMMPLPKPKADDATPEPTPEERAAYESRKAEAAREARTARTEPEPPKPKAEEKPSEPKSKILPAFLQKQPSTDAKDTATPPEEWPEELPGVKDQSAWKKFRGEYKNRVTENHRLNEELAARRANEGKLPPEVSERMTKLEKDNADLLGYVERYSLQNHPQFHQQIEIPAQNALNAAKRVLQDVGADPAQVDRLAASTGKAYYDAFDEITQGLPEAAKSDLSRAIGAFRDIDARRRAVLSDPKRSMEQLRKQDIEVQRKHIDDQNKQLNNTLNDIVASLRDKDKLEVLQDPDECEQIVKVARNILTTTDQKTLVAGIVLGASADSFRAAYLHEKERADKAEAQIKSMRNMEPGMEGEIGGEETPRIKLEDSYKRPFSQVFIEDLKRRRRG